MRKIIYSRPDGGVSVVSVPVDTDAALATAMARLPVSAVNAQIMSDAVIPTDRTFRNAWRQAVGLINHDLPSARVIAQEKVREARIPRFAHWDALWTKAQEDNDIVAMATIRANRQKLRDAPADARIANAANEIAPKTAMQAVMVGLP